MLANSLLKPTLFVQAIKLGNLEHLKMITKTMQDLYEANSISYKAYSESLYQALPCAINNNSKEISEFFLAEIKVRLSKKDYHALLRQTFRCSNKYEHADIINKYLDDERKLIFAHSTASSCGFFARNQSSVLNNSKVNVMENEIQSSEIITI